MELQLIKNLNNTSLKLCIYNVENLFLVNPNIGDSFKKPIDKIEWVARTIKEIDADITMLVEVGGLLSLDLFNSRYLQNEYFTALLPGNSDRGIEMGYLIHKRVKFSHQILSNKDLVLNFNYPHEQLDKSKMREHKFSRDISELRLVLNNEISFIILLVHLKSKLDKEGLDFNGQLRRKAECEALVATYNQRRSEFPNIPIIVAGDLNGKAQRHDLEMEFTSIYKETDLEDILEIIQEPIERRSTYFHFNRDFVREASQLDYIMLPPELLTYVKKEESGIYQYRDQHGVLLPPPQDSFQRYALPSDHYPVVVSLKF
ncbi:MAG: hypothetical protein HOP07_17465 [Bacteriovoracaceae bacterium]|nr:hypothetical protein [Bacteriovoracaceae bacterium]